MSSLILFNAIAITMVPEFLKTQLVVIQNNRILAVERNKVLKKFGNTNTNIIMAILSRTEIPTYRLKATKRAVLGQRILSF